MNAPTSFSQRALTYGATLHGVYDLAASARSAVFFDMEGTLVEDVPYNVDPALLRLSSGAIRALRLLDEVGLPLVVVTSQPGLASGRFTREAFARLQHALTEQIRREAGVTLTGFYACPHVPGPDGAPACSCRKPAPGLLRQAALAHRFDLSRSWMIGDIPDDIEAGQRAGCRTVLLDVGNETQCVSRNSGRRITAARICSRQLN